MLIGWNREHFFLIMRALLVNQDGMITWSWLAERASEVSWFPLKLTEMRFENLQTEMQLFWILNAIISSIVKENRRVEMNVELWIERGLFNNTRKNIIWTAGVARKSGNLWRLSLKDKLKFLILLHVIWYSKQRPPYHPEIAEDLLVLAVLAVKRRKKASRSFYSSFGHLVYEFYLILSIQSSIFPHGRSSPRKQRWIKLNRFHFYL